MSDDERMQDVTPTFIDVQTGEIATSTHRASIWWWGQGNGDDCNREMLFGNDDGTENVCLGCRRYVAVDVDVPDDTKAWALDEINQEYRADVVAKAFAMWNSRGKA